MDQNQAGKLENLQGEWVLTRIKAESNIMLKKTKGASFTLALGEEGKAYGSVACNRWNGGYELMNDQIRFGASASTRKRCIIKDPILQSLEQRYLSELEGPVNYRLTELELAIDINDKETWYFTRAKK